MLALEAEMDRTLLRLFQQALKGDKCVSFLSAVSGIETRTSLYTHLPIGFAPLPVTQYTIKMTPSGTCCHQKLQWS